MTKIKGLKKGSEKMAGEYIFTMNRMSKTYGPKKVLDDINLCFYATDHVFLIFIRNGSTRVLCFSGFFNIGGKLDGLVFPQRINVFFSFFMIFYIGVISQNLYRRLSREGALRRLFAFREVGFSE